MTQLEATPHADRYTPSFSVYPYLSPFLSLSHSLTAWPTDFQWHLIALFCFGFFSHIFSLVFHIMVHTLCSAYLSRGQEAVWTPPTSPHTPLPYPQLKIGMQFLDALHARFVRLNNFVCFLWAKYCCPWMRLALRILYSHSHSLVVVPLLMAIDIYGFASI